MKRVAIAALVVSVAVSASAEVRGAWTATTESEDSGVIRFSITTGKWQNIGETFALTRFTGLDAAAISAKTQTPVAFQIRSDAGTISFEGVFKEDWGAGQLRFIADPTYRDAIRDLGLDIETSTRRTEDEELFPLAIWDVSTAYIRRMLGVFPDASFREIRNARAAGVTPEYIQSIRALDVDVKSLRAATRLAAVGVTPDFIRQMATRQR